MQQKLFSSEVNEFIKKDDYPRHLKWHLKVISKHWWFVGHPVLFAKILFLNL